MLQLYSQLLRFPLFQGLSNGELSELVTHTKFGFDKFKAGSYVVRSGDKCDHLLFVVKGTMTASTQSADGGYILEEEIEAPYLLSLDRLFGLDQRHAVTCRATTDINTISLSKSEVARLCDHFVTFRINLLNILTTEAQRAHERLLHQPSSKLEQLITLFVADRCLLPVGHKKLRIRMVRLAEELNDSRRDVSAALNSMQAKGLLSLSRQMIDIQHIENLFEEE